jgi:hypothetical protein
MEAGKNIFGVTIENLGERTLSPQLKMNFWKPLL